MHYKFENYSVFICLLQGTVKFSWQTGNNLDPRSKEILPEGGGQDSSKNIK